MFECGIITATATVAATPSSPSTTQVNTSPPALNNGGITIALSAIPAPMPAKVMPETRPFTAAGARPTTAAAISTISSPPATPETNRHSPNHTNPKFAAEAISETAVSAISASTNGLADSAPRQARITAAPTKYPARFSVPSQKAALALYQCRATSAGTSGP
jgi:hypothetical protein